MKRYTARGGDAGVSGYRIGRDRIEIEFRDDSTYLYTYAMPGQTDVEAMKELAAKGEGLSTYINQRVRQRYAAKLR